MIRERVVSRHGARQDHRHEERPGDRSAGHRRRPPRCHLRATGRRPVRASVPSSGTRGSARAPWAVWQAATATVALASRLNRHEGSKTPLGGSGRGVDGQARSDIDAAHGKNAAISGLLCR
jgi:hypothetical protein